MPNRWWMEISVRRNRRGVFLWGVCLFCLFTAPGAGQIQPRRERADAETPQTGNDDERRQIAFGRKIHFRERSHARLLERIRAAVKNRDYLNGLRYLQRLIDSDDDRFVFVPGSDSPIGMRRAGEQILAELNDDGRDAYERMFGIAAAQRLREADRSIDVDGYREVLKRYFHTKAGFDAADRLARLAFDRGEFAAAAATWSRLLRDPRHRRRVTPRMRFALGVARYESGERQLAERVIAPIVDHRIQVAGRNLTPGEWLKQRRADSAHDAQRGDWRMPLGNISRNRLVSASAPFPRPVWSRSYQKQHDRQTDAVFEKWERDQSTAVAPKGVANVPIVVNGRVIIRDFEGIHALDLADGKRRWSFRPITTLAKSIAKAPPVVRADEDVFRQLDDPQTQTGFDLQLAYAENSTLGSLTSDGRLVFAIDDFKLNRTRPSRNRRFGRFGNTPAGDLSQRTNRLIALRIFDDPARPQQTRKPEWTVGTVPGPGRNPRALSNHYFLGPPLPVGGRLYAMTESKQVLYLVCLNASDGVFQWMQQLAVATNPIQTDFSRAVRSCLPTYADGIVICPTKTGLLCGVDAETGSLHWASYCGDDLENERHFSQFGAAASPTRRSGFWNTPRVIDGRVVYLPTESNQLHCIDTRSGKHLWTAPRGDGEYVAAVSETHVVLVGRRRTRGFTLSNGREVWTVATGMPSGRGIQRDGHVLVPLETGRIVTLDIKTGKGIGQSIPHPQLIGSAELGNTNARSRTKNGEWRPGNLIVADGMILSSEARHLRAFLPATTVLARTEAERIRRPDSTAVRIELAEVQLMLGRLDVADQHLTAVLRVAKAPVQRRRARTLLRELLYMQLADNRNDAARLLDRLAKLVESPEQRSRYLVRRAEFELQQGNFDGVLRVTQQFAGLDLKRLFPMPGDETHLVSAASWVPSVIGRIRSRFGPEALKNVSARIDTAEQQALASKGTVQLERFLAVYRDWPQAASVRAELAHRLVARGRYQHAELLLMTNRANSSPQVAAGATEQLARLWMNRGLHTRAATLLDELNHRFANTLLTDGRTTGRQFVEQIAPRHSAKLALRRLTGPSRRFRHVTISESRWFGTDPRLPKTLGDYRMGFRTPSDSPFELLDRGLLGERKLSVIDKASAVEVGTITIPLRHSYPMLSRNAHVGHFFSLGGPGEIHGVSLLEVDRGKPLWKTIPQGFDGRMDLVNVGPAGPTFCSFQARGTLIVVDPATGKLLWQRNGLDPSAGSISDPYSGLIGDEKALVLFAANRKSYTVYDTRTGAEIRRGRLEISDDHVRRMFGRRLAYVKREGNRYRFRIWDPLKDQFVLDIPHAGELHSSTTDQGNLILILLDQRMLVYDVDRGVSLLDTQLEKEEVANLTHLRVFRQGDRLFLNLQRTGHRPANRFSFYASSSIISAEHIRGDLLAFDLPTGKRLWTRDVPQQSILKPGVPNLPYLISVSRIREIDRGERYTMRIEAIDVTTGETIGENDNVFPDRYLHLTVSPDHAQVKLHGERTVISLDLFRDIQAPADQRGRLVPATGLSVPRSKQ